MEQFIKYVGLDVHGKTIASSVVDSGSSELQELNETWSNGTTLAVVVRKERSEFREIGANVR